MRQVYERAGVAIEDLPRGVYMEWRDGFFVGVNYSAAQVTLPIAKGSRMLGGGEPRVTGPGRGVEGRGRFAGRWSVGPLG